MKKRKGNPFVCFKTKISYFILKQGHLRVIVAVYLLTLRNKDFVKIYKITVDIFYTLRP